MQGWLADWYGVTHEPTMTTGDTRSMMRLALRSDGPLTGTPSNGSWRDHWRTPRSRALALVKASGGLRQDVQLR
jgi:hypothetical protein